MSGGSPESSREGSSLVRADSSSATPIIFLLAKGRLMRKLIAGVSFGQMGRNPDGVHRHRRERAHVLRHVEECHPIDGRRGSSGLLYATGRGGCPTPCLPI